jgi:uncharacterized RmlC-like cupin family protein
MGSVTQTGTRTGPRDDLGRLLVRRASDIATEAWENLRDVPGVWQKILWRSGDVTIGLIRVDPGAEKPAHVHHGAHHHIWMVSGECTMVGHRLDAGSYIYIPPGVEHEVSDVGPDGCVFFYTYRPLELSAAGEQPAPGEIPHGF